MEERERERERERVFEKPEISREKQEREDVREREIGRCIELEGLRDRERARLRE